ncbi:hypothetical protein MICA_2093 [Micavibrio aeruginosavorus ARL-13]|uniref:Uncharacterized protein n=1 Tax=Micavibrio aeruginosavorus (strain ARL-13) TaxID=856793 RepID=G2KQS2_MICAA|nr:hypothetical protein MICA_2093 [Micavibrio aeruginosavorus ARL-13]
MQAPIICIMRFHGPKLASFCKLCQSFKPLPFGVLLCPDSRVNQKT